MDSEDSRDGSGDAQSSSSSSSSSSRSRRSSSSGSETSKKDAKSPPRSPASEGPRSPSPENLSRSPKANANKAPRSPDNLSEAHSDINSPEHSMLGSPINTKSDNVPKSPSEVDSNIGSPDKGPKTPQSPGSSARSPPGSPESPSRPASPDSASQPTSPQSRNPRHSRTSSASPERSSFPSSPQSENKNKWSPKDKWRRHTKAEQKMVPVARERSQSESSQSSRSSSYNKRGAKDPATEEISEGEMESDQEDRKLRSKNKHEEKELDISHEDLSDVSDLDSMGQDDDKIPKKSGSNSPSSKSEARVNGSTLQQSPKSDGGKDAPKLEKVPQEKTCNTEDGEEQLDFEAEEGECVEPKPVEQANGDTEDKPGDTGSIDDVKPGRRSRGSSLEEGEVSDEAERRPEESEPRPVCRFFSRGACTWGVSCRFLHPGVTDKGNYNMFEVVRGVPAGAGAGAGGAPRDQPPPESAWERGLRTAKEMLRIANKRKEQDMDFEEKKLHLSVGGVVHDPDAELAYAAAAVGASPPRHEPPHRDPDAYRNPYGAMYRGRGFARVDEREYYERARMAPRERYERAYYEHEPPPADDAFHKRRVRSSREVTVQRSRRGDEWADPWMRAEPRRHRSDSDEYSSDSSASSSRSSRSGGARRKRRASSSSRQRLSPSVIVRERRLASARATAMNPPAPRRRAPSPAAARQLAANPPPPPDHRHKEEMDPYGRNKSRSSRDRKKYSRSSSSGSESSTSTSETESESHSSSTSGSSGARRARHARLLNAAARPRINPTSSAGIAAAVNIPNKKESVSDKESGGKKRGATSPVDPGPAKKAVSRREELLKQLKAVEDAIARKRSKI